MMRRLLVLFVGMLALLIVVTTCVTVPRRSPTARVLPRGDDVVVVCGRSFHAGSRVVLWSSADGFNAYLPHRFNRPGKTLPSNPATGCNTPLRYGTRAILLNDDGEPLPVSASEEWQLVRRSVDQIVVHYDAAGSSRRCFEVLHDERGLSAHFLIDVDGTIYQTLDVRERGRHAGKSNDRSIGIEIANPGAFPTTEELFLARDRARRHDANGTRNIASADRNQGFMTGVVQRRTLHQYPFTDAQYRALVSLCGALIEALPGIQPRYPQSRDGKVILRTLTAEEDREFSGIVGHWHVSSNKVDPGPAFDWRRLIRGIQARRGESVDIH
jgi:N-acetylmuramoyl-L-alanine amidase